MTRKKVLFLHGWSSDGSLKAAFIRSLGYDVLTPRLSDLCFSRAVRTAQKACDEYRPDVVVGSSRGGAAAMALDSGDTPLILLAPAWRRFGRVPKIEKANVVIVHSPTDEMVPFTDSIELCVNCPGVCLVPAGSDHRLNCQEGQKALANALRLLTGPDGSR